jgi:hypothetical protein
LKDSDGFVSPGFVLPGEYFSVSFPNLIDGSVEVSAHAGHLDVFGRESTPHKRLMTTVGYIRQYNVSTAHPIPFV